METNPQPLPKPRFELVNEFPVATLAPFVELSAEALAWCVSNAAITVGDLRSRLRRPGRFKCSEAVRSEFLRLLDPPGTPLEWPLHPDPQYRAKQHLEHLTGGLRGRIYDIVYNTKDPWNALVYVIHFEEDFIQYKGIGPGKLPAVLAWRDAMRVQVPRPNEGLTSATLNGRHTYHDRLEQPLPGVALPNRSPSPSGSSLTLTIQLDLADPLLVEKFKAIQAILG